jgi:hypothetical protein
MGFGVDVTVVLCMITKSAHARILSNAFIVAALITRNQNFPKGFDIFMIIAYTDRIIIIILTVKTHQKIK